MSTLPRSLRRSVVIRAAALAAAVSLALGGCGAGDADSSPEADPGQTPATSVTSTTTPTLTDTGSTPETPASESEGGGQPTTGASPSTSSPTSAATTSPSAQPTPRGGPLSSALIPADDLPGFSDDYPWAVVPTPPALRRQPVPVCSRSTLVAIGGVRAVRRDFRGQAGAPTSAIQAVVKFPDELTSSRSESILLAWHDRCTQQARSLGLDQVRVGEVQQAQTESGTARYWMTTYVSPRNPGATWHHAEGFVRIGERLSYVVLRTSGSPGTPEPNDADPVAEALDVAADRLLGDR